MSRCFPWGVSSPAQSRGRQQGALGDALKAPLRSDDSEQPGPGQLPHHQVLLLTADAPHGAAASSLQRVKDKQVPWQWQPAEFLCSQAEVDGLNKAPMMNEAPKPKDGSSILCTTERGQAGKLGARRMQDGAAAGCTCKSSCPCITVSFQSPAAPLASAPKRLP